MYTTYTIKVHKLNKILFTNEEYERKNERGRNVHETLFNIFQIWILGRQDNLQNKRGRKQKDVFQNFNEIRLSI